MRALTLGMFGLLGCGGSTSDAGNPADDAGPVDAVYEVESHTKNGDGCGVEGETLLDDPWFRLAENDDGGLDYYTCRGEFDCDVEADPFRSFRLEDSQWVGVEAWHALDASDGEGCRLYKRVHVASADASQAEIERWSCRTINRDIADEAECEALVDPEMECTWDGPNCHDYEVVIASAP